MQNFKKTFWAIILTPVFYSRWSWLLYIPFGFLVIVQPGNVGDRIGAILLCCVGGSVFHSFIIGNLDGLIPLTNWAIKKFNIKYKYVGSWRSDTLSMRSGWGYPVIKVNGIEHNWTVVRSGSNTHDYETSIKRKVIFTHLWGNAS